jgi:multidrug efflux pump subunit AcrA (membrane-fusion protein)
MVGTILGAVGAIYSGIAQMQAANYQAAIANMNAQFAEQKARDAIERAADEEQRHRMKTAQIVGAQMAAFGSNGVDVGFGSPLDTILDTVKLGELDALEIRRNGELEAYDFRVQKFNFLAEAEMAKSKATSALIGGFFAGATKFTQGYATVLGQKAASIGQV